MSGPVSVGARSSSTAGITNSDDFYKNQALRAALASQKPPITPPKRLTRNGFVSNGALAAAARAGTASQSSNQEPRTASRADRIGQGTTRIGSPEHISGASTSPQRTMSTLTTSPATHLAAPTTTSQPGPRQASPSQIAAVRAAARSATPGTGVRGKNDSPERKDETPIPATNTLVKLFEARSKEGPELKVKPITESGPPVVLSPKPIRAASVRLLPSDKGTEKDVLRRDSTVQPAFPLPRPQAAEEKPKSLPRSKSIDLSRVRDAAASAVASSPAIPRRSSSRHNSTNRPALPAPEPERSISPPRQQVSRLAATQPVPRPTSTTRSITTQMLVPEDGVRASSVAKRGAHQNEHVRAQLNADSLANAMVAGSLASSRAPSPHKTSSQAPQPPPSRRGGKGLHVSSLFSHHTGSSSTPQRQPSPGKATTLRTTLRSAPPDPEGPVTGKGGGGGAAKLRKNGKAPELDSITMADRKLYEGVWAANRGILVPADGPGTESAHGASQPNKAAEEVHGYVVRDVWSRSGLEQALLEQIWRLVDGGENDTKRSGPGRLDRQEFVVGMWLVDQALMGRKLPRRVPDEVWASLRIGSGFEFRR